MCTHQKTLPTGMSMGHVLFVNCFLKSRHLFAWIAHEIRINLSCSRVEVMGCHQIMCPWVWLATGRMLSGPLMRTLCEGLDRHSNTLHLTGTCVTGYGGRSHVTCDIVKASEIWNVAMIWLPLLGVWEGAPRKPWKITEQPLLVASKRTKYN